MSQIQVDVLQSKRFPHIRMPIEYLSSMTGFPEWDVNKVPYKKSSVVFHEGLLWHLQVDLISAEPAQGTDWKVVALDELAQLADIANINIQLGLLNTTTSEHGSSIIVLNHNVDAINDALHGTEDTDGALYLLRDALLELQNKVDAVAGKGLSANDFTDELYTKLIYADGAKYKGIFQTLDALKAFSTNPIGGDYGDVNGSGGVSRYYYDDASNSWMLQQGGVGYTPASIKQLYDSNPGVESFTTDHMVDIANSIKEGDARLTDAREWNANTVTKAAAEAGTSNVRRAWTAERVRQAIAAANSEDAVVNTRDYAIGLVIDNPNVIIRDGDDIYFVNTGTSFPITLQGPTIEDETDIFMVGAGTVEEAPKDSQQYARTNGGWEPVSGSDENYTTLEKQKLAALEPSHYRGLYVNEATLATITSPVIGDYADVDNITGVMRWVYDGSAWIEQEGSTDITASQVKQMYEVNADTNAFTDAEKAKLGAIATGATKNASDSQLRDRSTHTGSQAHTTISGLGTAATKNVDTDIPSLDINKKIPIAQLPNLDSKYPAIATDMSITVNGVKVGGESTIKGTATPTKLHSSDTTTTFYVTHQARKVDISLHPKSTGKAELKVGTTSTGQGKSNTLYENDENRARTTLQTINDSGEAIQIIMDAPVGGPTSVNISSDVMNINNEPIATQTFVTSNIGNLVDAAAAGKVDKVIGKGLSSNDYTDDEQSKLGNIEEYATKNETDAQLRDRASHTGTQDISTITGLDTVLSGFVEKQHGKDLIEPAPVNTNVYGRMGGAWVAVGAQSGGAVIDDNVTNNINVWSSAKTAEEIVGMVDDDTSSLSKTYSSARIDREISDIKQVTGMNPIVAALIFGG